MGLTREEELELQALEQEEVQARQLIEPTQQSGLTPEEEQELAALEQEEQMANSLVSIQEAPMNPEEEADLGTLTRAQYSLEPLESNRRALLIQKFGAENVKETPEGDVYVRQEGEFRPVNRPGFSFTDVANVAGALPEGLGAVVGAVGGGAGTLGAGTVPGAIAGGAAGSAIRQGLSAAIGTPQVAPASERAGEVGMSALMGGGGALLGRGVKSAIKKVFPRFRVDKSLKNLAKELDIPEPTPAQLAGGRDLQIEKELAEYPLFGRSIRKKVEKQVGAIKKNLSKEVGDIGDADIDRTTLGGLIKDEANTLNKTIKERAGDLFDEVAEKGRDIGVDAPSFKQSLNDQLSKIGLFDNQGRLLEHSAGTGLTETQFLRVQGVAKKALDQIDRSAQDGLLSATDINVIRKFVDSNIKEGQREGFDNVALVRLREGLLDVTEDMLGVKSKSLKRNFKEARGLWGQYIKNINLLNKGKNLNINNLSDEKVLERAFRDKKSVQMLKELVDPETAKKAGDEFIRDLLSSKASTSGDLRAKSALNLIRKKREAIREAIGPDSYNRVVKNLEFLDRINQPINPSGTATTKLRQVNWENLSQGALRSLQRKGRTTVRTAVERLPERGSRAIRALTDPYQRGVSFNLFAGPKISYRSTRVPAEEETE